jgi:signal peptidase II
MPLARRNDLLLVLTAITVIVCDQLTKHWIVSYFTAQPTPAPIPVLGNVLDIEYVRNTGVAFSLLSGQTVLFLLIAFAIAVIGILYWRMRDAASLPLKLAFGLILGGAIGNNLIDRLTRGYVVDFIHFHLDAIGFNFAVFNVADSGITVGVILLALLLWQEGTRTHDEVQADSTSAVKADAGAPAHEHNSEAAPRVRNPVVGGR